MGREDKVAVFGFLIVCACMCSVLTEAAHLEYSFVISNAILNLDCTPGADRVSALVNGKLPGPTITATEGDTVTVHVRNEQDLPATIHWHGLVQRGTQWYDGVPGITQCGIRKGGNYTYRLQLNDQRGTFWWHSHQSTIRATVFGALIVKPRPSKPDPLAVHVSKEFLMLVGDWYHKTATELGAKIALVPDALHVNGRTSCAKKLQQFNVVQGRWYRLRMINAALSSQLSVQIQDHAIHLFEVEGNYLKPYAVRSLDIAPGQSYSVIFNANKPINNYWIAVNGRYDSEPLGRPAAVIVLHYAGAKAGRPTTAVPKGPTTAANPTFGTVQDKRLRSLKDVKGVVDTSKVTKVMVFAINQNLVNGSVYFTVNNVSVIATSIPYLYADYANISGVYDPTLQPSTVPAGFYNDPPLPPCKIGAPDIELPFKGVIHLVVQNHLPPGGNHPFHLHGYDFYVVGSGNGTFNESAWDQYTYNTVDPPKRNTETMLSGDWIALRFVADNPGQWIMHCHLEQHVHHGMQMIFRVVGPPGSLPPPPADYPECATG